MKKIFTRFVAPLILMFTGGNALLAQAVNVTSVTPVTLPATSCTNTFMVVSGVLSNSYSFGSITSLIIGSNIIIDDNYTGGITLPVITPFSDTINLGMLPAGTYTVTTNGRLNGGISSTLVNSLSVISCCPAVPSFTMSDTSLCIGGSAVLTNTSTGAVNQAWYENNVLVSNNVNYNTGTLNTPGTYTYKLVVDDGSCSDSTEQVLNVYPFPKVDLGNDTTICKGNILILDAGPGHDSISWSTSATTRTISVVSAGNYQVTVYENGCPGMDDIIVNVILSPVVDLGPDTVICEGDSLILNVTQTGVTYEWQDASVNSVFAASDSGIYWVKVTNGNGCTVIDSILLGLKDCSAIGISRHTGSKSMVVYPNPARDHFLVRLPAEADRMTIRIELYNILGKKVADRIVPNAGEVVEMPLNIPAGQYIVKISDAQQRQWATTLSVRE